MIQAIDLILAPLAGAQRH